MGDRKRELIFGCILLGLGVAGILKQIFQPNIGGYISTKALVMLGLGVFFEWKYFTTKSSPGLLIPGGILTVIGLDKLLTGILGTYLLSNFPADRIGVVLGLFQFYWYGDRKKWLLIPIVILSIQVLDTLCRGLFRWFNGRLIWPIALILLGILFLLNDRTKSR